MSSELDKTLLQLVESQGRIHGALERIESDVREHMRRTANLEGRVETLMQRDAELEIQITNVSSRLKGAGVLFGILATIAGLLLATLRALGL